MTEPDVFILADQSLNGVVQQIQDDQWHMDMPENFVMADGRKLDLRGVINYHAYDDAWVPDMLAGRTMEEVGASKFDGDLLGENPKENFAAIVEKAVAAAKNLDDLDRTVHFTYGNFPAREALKHITSFRGLRVYDLAKALGQDTTMPEDLVQGLWEQISPEIEQWRAIGVFPPEVAVAEDGPLQDRLLGMTGRQP
jgi:uncharacterized protein (TIGR03086 family)